MQSLKQNSDAPSCGEVLEEYVKLAVFKSGQNTQCPYCEAKFKVKTNDMRLDLTAQFHILETSFVPFHEWRRIFFCILADISVHVLSIIVCKLKGSRWKNEDKRHQNKLSKHHFNVPRRSCWKYVMVKGKLAKFFSAKNWSPPAAKQIWKSFKSTLRGHLWKRYQSSLLRGTIQIGTRYVRI